MINDKTIITVKALIFYKDFGTFYFLELTRSQTLKYPNKGDLPGGKIEEYESPSNAIIREVKEETGLALDQIHFLTTYYFLLDNQKYKEYLFCALVPKQEIIINPQEHKNFGWIHFDKLEESTLHPNVKKIIFQEMPKIYSFQGIKP